MIRAQAHSANSAFLSALFTWWLSRPARRLGLVWLTVRWPRWRCEDSGQAWIDAVSCFPCSGTPRHHSAVWMLTMSTSGVRA